MRTGTAMSWAFQARQGGPGRAGREEDGRSVRNELMTDISAQARWEEQASSSPVCELYFTVTAARRLST